MSILAKKMFGQAVVNPYNDSFTKLYLKFENNANDSSNGASETHTPTASGVTYSSSIKKVGNYSAYFDSVDYITFPDSVDWSLSNNDFTNHGYVRRVGGAVQKFFFGQWAGASDYSWTWFFHTDNKLAFAFYVSGTQIIYSDSALTADTWYHFAGVRNGSEIAMYVDGTKQTQTYTIGTSSIANSSRVLRISGFSENGAYPFTGYLDALYLDNGIARWTTDFTPPT